MLPHHHGYQFQFYAIWLLALGGLHSNLYWPSNQVHVLYYFNIITKQPCSRMILYECVYHCPQYCCTHCMYNVLQDSDVNLFRRFQPLNSSPDANKYRFTCGLITIHAIFRNNRIHIICYCILTPDLCFRYFHIDADTTIAYQ